METIFGQIIKDVPMPEKIGRLVNLENYPDMLWRKIERMEKLGLLDKNQSAELDRQAKLRKCCGWTREVEKKTGKIVVGMCSECGI